MRIAGIILLLLPHGHAAQGQDDYRVIGISGQATASISADFYVKSIEDQRAFRANLGIVNRGPRKDLKRPLLPESGFIDAVLKQMNSWVIPAEGAEPVVAKLRELYLWEKQGLNAGQGFLRLEMAFAGTDGEDNVISIELSGKELTVAGGHTPRLEMALFRCLQQYAGQRSRNARPGPSALANSEEGGRRAGVLAAVNFLALWKGGLFPVAGNIRRKGGLFRYGLNQGRGNKQGQEFPHYALKKEDKLFIWAGNYPGGGNYYTRALEQGRYLFLIDDITIKPGSGLQEAELGQFSGKAGIIIDMETGLPQIVDEKLMEKLMEPYPELREQYLFKDILEYPFQLTRVQNVIAEINRREAAPSTQ